MGYVVNEYGRLIESRLRYRIATHRMDCCRIRRFLPEILEMAPRVVWCSVSLRASLRPSCSSLPLAVTLSLQWWFDLFLCPCLPDLVLFQPKGPCLIHVWYMPGLSGYFDPPSQFCRFLSRALELTARIERTFLIIQKVGLRLPYWFSFCVPHRTVLLTRSNCLKFVLVAT